MKTVQKETIVIATKNTDKFRIVVDILLGLGGTGFTYCNLKDLGITEEMEEKGTIEERAKQKVLFYKNFILDTMTPRDVVSIIGVDDGIYIEKEGKGTAQSKEITDLILSDSYLHRGDTVIIQRSYFAYFPYSKKDFSIVTNIPLQFLGNPKGITRKEGSYPLSHVLGHIGTETTIVDNSKESNIRYNVLHSKNLTPVFKHLH
ncbi:MAG: hypothetical protein ACR2LN_04775 [Candidatus Levyibacteriota bacterium]